MHATSSLVKTAGMQTLGLTDVRTECVLEGHNVGSLRGPMYSNADHSSLPAQTASFLRDSRPAGARRYQDGSGYSNCAFAAISKTFTAVIALLALSRGAEMAVASAIRLNRRNRSANAIAATIADR